MPYKFWSNIAGPTNEDQSSVTLVTSVKHESNGMSLIQVIRGNDEYATKVTNLEPTVSVTLISSQQPTIIIVKSRTKCSWK